MKNMVGLFKNEQDADKAITELQHAGFSKSRFHLLARNNILQRVDREEDVEQGTIQADHKLGAAGGAAVGGLTGLLMSVGALVIPGIGPAVAAGALATTVAATGVGAAAGGLLGALTSLGISEEEAHVYAEGVKRGGILVVVEADDAREPVASTLMRQAGAIEVDVERETWRAEGWTGFDESTVPDENYPTIPPPPS